MPSPHLLHVLSRPIKVSDEVWTKWYVEEHIPDLVNHHVSKTGAVYRQIQNPLAMDPPDDKTFFAVYQSDSERCLDSDGFRDGVRHTSDLFPDGATTKQVGNFDIRNYRLIQDYDPNHRGDGAPPYILHVELHPSDEKDMDTWYREEHLEMISRTPGYRRSLRYRAGIMEDGSPGGNVAPFMALHEFDKIDDLGGPVTKETNETEWTKKILASVKVFNTRVFKLLSSEGY